MVDYRAKILELYEQLLALSSRLQVFQSKKAKLVVLVTSIIISFLLVIPTVFDNSALKFKIEQEISTALQANFAINNTLDIEFLPSLAVVIKDATLQNYGYKNKVYNAYLGNVKVKLSFLEILQGNFAVKKVIFSNVIVERYYSLNAPKTFDNELRDRISKIINQSETNKPKNKDSGFSYSILAGKTISFQDLKPENIARNNVKIICENSDLIFYDKSARKRSFEQVNFKVNFSKNSVVSQGYFLEDDIINEFTLKAHFNSSWKKSYFTINSPFFSFKIKGNFTAENKGVLQSEFKGNLQAEIFELKPFFKSYVTKNENIYNKIKSGLNSIKISSEVQGNLGEFIFSNLVINSNLLNGKGEIKIDILEKFTALDVKLDLDNFDLDKTISSEKIDIGNQNPFISFYNKFDETTELLSVNKKEVAQPQNLANQDSKNETKSQLETIAPIKDFDVSAEIKIKNVKYINGEIKNVDLYTTISNNGEILILPIIFEIPGQGKLRANGVLFQDNNLPKFIGKFDVMGKKLKEILQWFDIKSQNLKFDNLNEYIVYSDVFLVPNNVLLSNFYLNLNSDESELLGEIKIDTTNKTTYITNKFHISYFNIDDYFLVSGENIYFSRGSLLKKLLWLNEITTNDKFELNFDKIIYKGETFKNQSAKLTFGQGYFEVQDLHLQSEKTDLMANIIIDIRDKIPKFDLNITANSFHYENNLKDATNLDKKIIKNDFVDQFFSLPSLEDFNGNISLKIGNLYLDGIEVKDAEINGIMRNGNIEISKFNCQIYNGAMTYKGNLIMGNDKVFNGNINLEKVSLEQLLPDLIGVNNIFGIANISSSILGSSHKKSEFAKNFISETKFSANAVVMGYGLNDLITKMFYRKYYQKELQDPQTILFNPQSSTIFEKISGTILSDKNKNNSFKINLGTTAANAIFVGKFDLLEHTIDSKVNLIFLTGSSKKQIPINIATSIAGEFGNFMTNSNLNQINQYLGLPINQVANNSKQSENIAQTNQNANGEVNNNSDSSDIISKKFMNAEDEKATQEIIKAMQDPDGYAIKKMQEEQKTKNKFKLP